MSYYSDLTTYEYYTSDLDPLLLNTGWLDRQHRFPVGVIDDPVFFANLWAYCCNPIRQSKGFHECEFCASPQFPVIEQLNNEQLSLGSAEIRVPGADGIVYAAPDLIFHYIVRHRYLPPQGFIEAVISSSVVST